MFGTPPGAVPFGALTTILSEREREIERERERVSERMCIIFSYKLNTHLAPPVASTMLDGLARGWWSTRLYPNSKPSASPLTSRRISYLVSMF